MFRELGSRDTKTTQDPRETISGALTCFFAVDDTGIEPVTPSVSRKCSPTELIVLGTAVLLEVETGFEPVYTALQAVASPLGHSTVVRLFNLSERTTGLEPATLTLAR